MFYSTAIPDQPALLREALLAGLIGNPDSSATGGLDFRFRGNDKNALDVRQMPQGQSGQALIESCLVIALICLILAGLFQLSQLYSAKEIVSYACARGARARTVGFNDFMVKKTVRVATIPNAGKMTFPEFSGGPLGQMTVERGRIPLYLGAEWHMLDGILQYEDWETINYSYTDDSSLLFGFSVSQNLPLRYFPAFFRAFYRDDSIPIGTELRLDNHAALYLE